MIELLTRSGCRLCEPVAGWVEVWSQRLGLPLRIIDIDLDLRLMEEFGDRVPVVRRGRLVLAEGRVRKWRLVRRLIWSRLTNPRRRA